MLYLILVSFIWAFSFGIIKNYLTGINASMVSFIRLGISFIFFLPFIKTKNLKFSKVLILLGIGALQYGVMYISYISAYGYLKAYQVALLTIFTPIYVILINDLIEKKIEGKYWLAALIATAGAGIILINKNRLGAIATGIILMQISNLSFAAGQIFYKKTMSEAEEISDLRIFGFLFLGGVIVTGLFALIRGNFGFSGINKEQWLTLFYLGAIASGAGFFLWNYGLRKVNAGTLSIFNNLKIPLAIFVSLLFFGEKANLTKLIIGLAIILSAFYFTENKSVRISPKTNRGKA